MHFAVDLDGTLAEYHGFNKEDPYHIGCPVPAIVERVNAWILAGHKVSLFTARVSGDDHEVAAEKIREWLFENKIHIQNITAIKEKSFTEIWDDRATGIKRNTGMLVASDKEALGHNDTGTHYRRTYKGINLDPARICAVYNVTNMVQAGIVKKALRAGSGGKKGIVEDIDDIITAANRWKEMLKEDC